jgi:hypothetical protein
MEQYLETRKNEDSIVLDGEKGISMEESQWMQFLEIFKVNHDII